MDSYYHLNIDAFVIVDNLRFGRITAAIYSDDYRYKALQTLTRTRFSVVQNLTREKQRFMNYLFMKCSGLAQEKVFSNTYGSTALALIEEFETPDDIANMDVDQLVEFLVEKGKNRFPNGDFQVFRKHIICNYLIAAASTQPKPDFNNCLPTH